MPELEWAAWALTDLLAIVEYIVEDNPDAAQRLKDDIEAKAATLPENPKAYRPAAPPNRVTLLPFRHAR